MASKEDKKSKIPVLEQTSAGGVTFRYGSSGPEIVIISVGPQERWQLPKGLVDPGESPEITAIREVREETGIETELISPIDTIEYWYMGSQDNRPVRFHKFVHFFLLRYKAGNVNEHDREVNEAQWVSLEEAKTLLTFKSEREIVEKAEAMIKALNPNSKISS
jgi:8-oxo-dGTP pyrophosphatase MutT (NUDIX family)